MEYPDSYHLYRICPSITVIPETVSVLVVPVPLKVPLVAPVTVSPMTSPTGSTSKVNVNSVVVTVPDAVGTQAVEANGNRCFVHNHCPDDGVKIMNPCGFERVTHFTTIADRNC